MKKKPELSLTDLADAAFQKAAVKVLERSAKYGTPLIVRGNTQQAAKSTPLKSDSKKRPSRKKK